MQARVLFLTDLHKRDCDFTTITGYTRAIDLVQEDILKFIAEKHVTHLVIGGDWYDKGYRSINRTFNDVYYDMALSRAVNGNAFLCRGNHLYIERDSNPEMYIIQPCDDMQPVHWVYSGEDPIFKSPNTVQVGPIQINLFHFSKENKDYIARRNPETTFNVGVYHDDSVVPSSVRQASGDHGITTTSTLIDTYKNIDLAICNHIHMAVGLVKVQLQDRTLNMFVPGALCITKNKASDIHSTVELPVITLEDDNSVKVQLAKFSLHTDVLKFYNKTETKRTPKEDISSMELSPESIGSLYRKETFDTNLQTALRRKGYAHNYLSLVDKAVHTGVGHIDAIKLIYDDGASLDD